jgi:tRNA (guanine9-N1)-methyltransferase
VTSVEKMRQAIEPNGKGQKIAIDLSYQKIMNEKEIRSLSNQLKYSYGVVKSMEDPFGLLLFQCDQVLQKALSRFGGENWLVKWYEKPLTEVFEASVSSRITTHNDMPLKLDP